MGMMMLHGKKRNPVFAGVFLGEGGGGVAGMQIAGRRVGLDVEQIRHPGQCIGIDSLDVHAIQISEILAQIDI